MKISTRLPTFVYYDENDDDGILYCFSFDVSLPGCFCTAIASRHPPHLLSPLNEEISSSAFAMRITGLENVIHSLSLSLSFGLWLMVVVMMVSPENRIQIYLLCDLVEFLRVLSFVS